MAGSGRGGSRLPEEQLREREKDGRVRRFVWDVLTLRMLAYVFAQPASFTFIVSFLFITVSIPPMAVYIKSADRLPDLDTMRSWNAYLGRLPSLGLCVERENISLSLSTPPQPVTSAFVDFHVDSDSVGAGVELLIANLSGVDLRTKIKDSSSGERVDQLVSVTLYLPLAHRENDSGLCGSSCTGCVDISAPDSGTPSRHPQIPGSDFTFRTRVLRSVNRPDQPGDGVSCSQFYSEAGEEVLVARRMRLGGDCKEVLPHRERYRKHGLINIYLTQGQKKESYSRMLLGTLGVAVIGLAFAVGIGCTERPPKPKNRPE